MKAVLLDLDGTLVDSRPGIIASYTAALRGLGHEPAPGTDMTALIGPPIGQAFASLLAPFGDDRIERATALYREHYAASGLLDCTVYDGVADALRALTASGLALYVATSKRTVFARRIIENARLLPCFAAIHGSEPGGLREDKAALIAHLLATERLGASEAVMVGDRAFDIIGARANGLLAIGALWGYGSREELAGADCLAATPDGLPGLIGA